MYQWYFESSYSIASQLIWQTTYNIATWLTNQVNNHSLIPSTGVIQLTWLWRWQPQGLLKCQSLSITLLFRILMQWLLGPNLSQFYHFLICYIFTFIRQFNRGIKTIIIHSKYFPNSDWLLMTKFGRILRLMRKWHQKCSLLQVNAPLTVKTWGRDWVVFVVETKMADTSLVSRVRTRAGTRSNSG